MLIDSMLYEAAAIGRQREASMASMAEAPLLASRWVGQKSCARQRSSCGCERRKDCKRRRRGARRRQTGFSEDKRQKEHYEEMIRAQERARVQEEMKRK